jgi:hypothetical protein
MASSATNRVADAALAAVGVLVALAYIGRSEAVTHRHLVRWHRADA